jgi:hypothetical protein
MKPGKHPGFFRPLPAHARHPPAVPAHGHAGVAGRHNHQPGSARGPGEIAGPCGAHGPGGAAAGPGQPSGRTDRRRGPRRTAPRRTQRGPAREAPAVVAAPVALLSQPVQPVADGAGGHLLGHRRHQGGHRHHGHGGAVHRAALLAGAPFPRGGRPAQVAGQQHRDRAAARAATRSASGRARTGGCRTAPHRTAHSPAGAGRRAGAVGRRHDPGRPAPARCQGPVRRAVGDDGRVPAGGEIPVAARPQGHQPAGAGQHGVHGHQRGLGFCHRGGAEHGQSHLFRRPGPTRHRPPTARPRLVPDWGEQGQLAADPLHGGDGAAGAAAQRIHQGRLAAGAVVRPVDGRGPDAGNAADDRHLDAGARRGVPVAQEGDREAAGRDPEFRRHGRAVYRQDRHADAGPDRAGPAYRTPGETNRHRC